jgi:hypothetical protein
MRKECERSYAFFFSGFDAPLRFSELGKVRRDGTPTRAHPQVFSFRRSSGKEKFQLLRLNVN